MEKGIVSDCWKVSTIVLIPKVNNTIRAEEFRLFNKLPVDEKKMECVRVVKIPLTQNVQENNNLIVWFSLRTLVRISNFFFFNFFY